MSERIAPPASGGTSSTGASTPDPRDTESRAPLTERIQSTFSNAASEHRANADASTSQPLRRTAKAPGKAPGKATGRAPGKAPRRARLRLR